MFSLYGLSGPLFQGPFADLARLPPVERRRPVGVIRRIGDEAAGTARELRAGTSLPPTSHPAAEAYQAMLPESLERGPLYRAQQIMQSEVIAVHADDDVAHAWRTLTGNRIHQAPVLDAREALVGIVSERHLLTAVNVDADGVRDVLFKRVRDVMRSPVVAAAADTDIRQIARVMLERDVDGVPIVNAHGHLLGFISRSDILAAVVNEPPLSVWR